MPQVSLFRLYSLRAVYLIIVVGLALVVWPSVIHHAQPWGLSQGVVKCMLAALSLLCVLGIRYPLQMLPILMWELIWKTIWLVTVPLPLYLNGTFTDKLMPNVIAIGMVVLVYLVMPWSYVWQNYVKQPGTPWFSPKS